MTNKTAPAQQPNILFLLPDQLRHDFLGCYGADFLKTPTIDSLAENGIKWETAISPAPICVPARASMLTGQHAHTAGVINNLSWIRPDRRDMGVQTWPEHLGQAGYKTAAIGKMHFYPWDLSEGFQTRIIAEDKRHIDIEDDYHYALKEAGFKKEHARTQQGYTAQKGASINDLPDALHVDRWVTRKTVDYINALDSDQPFALMVGFPGPHCPYDPPKAALDKIDPKKLPPASPATAESKSHHDVFVAAYKQEWADLDYETLSVEEITVIRQHYAALIECLDTDIKDIMQALRESGKLDNTIVVFASDHGDYVGDLEMVGKGYFHEPSIRVPLIVADFRNPKAQIASEPASLLDLYPSFLNWAGVELPENVDGHPLSQIPQGRCIVGVTSSGVMARTRDWKLVRYKNGTEALYDLKNDPSEQVNLIAENSVIRQKLDIALTQCLVDGLDNAHADKKVIKAKTPDAFYKRDWLRPYPAHLV